MKARLSWVFFFVAAIVLSGCEPTDVNTDFDNYWSSNSLVRMKLRGKVKTLQAEGERLEFNEKGFITSSSFFSDDYSTSVTYLWF